MAGIFPIPTGRSADMLVQRRLLSQLSFDQLEVVRLQNQLSTGRRISAPSEDAPAALRAMELQRVLEQKAQAKVNLSASQSYLSASDNAISDVARLLSDVRGLAVGAADSTSGEAQRQAAAQEVRESIKQLINIGNQQFRGRSLFGGSETALAPFAYDGEYIVYRGNEAQLRSFADLNALFGTNVSGHELFGAVSPAVQGSADLNPALTAQTRLNDLRGGLGVHAGSIRISDGNSARVIDLSTATTVGDVARLIENNPPDGRQVTVTITATGLSIDLDDAGGGNLTVREVASGKTASDLGILNVLGTGTNPIVGQDLNPKLSLTTKLSDLFGGPGGGVLFDQSSGVQIVNGGKTFTLDFQGAETVEDLLNVFNAAGANLLASISETGNGINVRSRLSGADFSIGENGGATAEQLGIRSFTRGTLLNDLNHGQGTAAAAGTDFTIRRTDGVELAIDISSANSIGDVIDLINGHIDNQDPLTAVVARLATVGNGVELVDNNASGTGPLTIRREVTSQAAWELGLVARGETETVAAAGVPSVLVGRDVNPQETKGVFNSLLRLNNALTEFDLAQISRTTGLLDDDFDRVNYSRAEIGARARSLDALQQRLENEDIELRSALSLDLDVDLVQAISELTARQASLEASLRSIGRTFQLSLLNFL